MGLKSGGVINFESMEVTDGWAQLSGISDITGIDLEIDLERGLCIPVDNIAWLADRST